MVCASAAACELRSKARVHGIHHAAPHVDRGTLERLAVARDGEAQEIPGPVVGAQLRQRHLGVPPGRGLTGGIGIHDHAQHVGPDRDHQPPVGIEQAVLARGLLELSLSQRDLLAHERHLVAPAGAVQAIGAAHLDRLARVVIAFLVVDVDVINVDHGPGRGFTLVARARAETLQNRRGELDRLADDHAMARAGVARGLDLIHVERKQPPGLMHGRLDSERHGVGLLQIVLAAHAHRQHVQGAVGVPDDIALALVPVVGIVARAHIAGPGDLGVLPGLAQSPIRESHGLPGHEGLVENALLALELLHGRFECGDDADVGLRRDQLFGVADGLIRAHLGKRADGRRLRLAVDQVESILDKGIGRLQAQIGAAIADDVLGPGEQGVGGRDLAVRRAGIVFKGRGTKIRRIHSRHTVILTVVPQFQDLRSRQPVSGPL